jgi:glycosyltransferase involved in cell wall biosynthesis
VQVSVIIPTYNAEAWLHRAVASALAQEGVTFELILVDNNSTDGTFALLGDLARRYPDLVTVTRETRQGSAAARNHGLRLARGEWIQFLDADDELLPGKLARQLALATADTDWIVGASVRRGLDGSETVSELNPDPWKGLVHNGGLGHTNANLICREILLRVGGQNEDLPNGVDTDLYFRLLQAGAVTTNDELPGAVYHDRPGYRLSELGGSVSRRRSARLKAAVIVYLRETRPAYYRANAAFFRSALLNAIRIVATADLGEAEGLVREYFSNGIRREDLELAILPRFARLYPQLGFSTTERLRLRARHLLPAILRRQLKGR